MSRITPLLELVGCKDVNEAFTAASQGEQGTPATRISWLIWTELLAFQDADHEYEKALLKLTRHIAEEQASDRPANAMWLEQASQQAAKAAADMERSARTVKMLNSVREEI